MFRKLEWIILWGGSTWLVRAYLGRDPQTETRKYLNLAILDQFRRAHRFLNLKLQKLDNGRVSRAASSRLALVMVTAQPSCLK
jgi:hypothetical protein